MMPMALPLVELFVVQEGQQGVEYLNLGFLLDFHGMSFSAAEEHGLKVPGDLLWLRPVGCFIDTPSPRPHCDWPNDPDLPALGDQAYFPMPLFASYPFPWDAPPALDLWNSYGQDKNAVILCRVKEFFGDRPAIEASGVVHMDGLRMECEEGDVPAFQRPIVQFEPKRLVEHFPPHRYMYGGCDPFPPLDDDVYMELPLDLRIKLAVQSVLRRLRLRGK